MSPEKDLAEWNILCNFAFGPRDAWFLRGGQNRVLGGFANILKGVYCALLLGSSKPEKL